MQDSALSPEWEEFIRALPKAELHVHLEGSIQPVTLLALTERNGVDLGCHDEAGVRELYTFRDFAHFIELYAEMSEALRNPEDFALIVEDLGREASRQNTRYLETTFTAGTHYRAKGIPFDELIDAVAEGAERARRSYGVQIRFILDHVRGFSVEDCWQTAEWCVLGRDKGVVALGLGGYEPGNPASQYGEVIRWVQQQGVAFVPHAGEAAGPEGIWDAMQFNPPRIGHGFRAADDPRLVEYLREHGTVLEICPTSNIYLRNVASVEEHPLRRLWEGGVAVTLNSDDPPMFHTTLTDEYRLAASHFGFSHAELAAISLTAVRAALVAPEEKERLRAEFEREITGLL